MANVDDFMPSGDDGGMVGDPNDLLQVTTAELLMLRREWATQVVTDKYTNDRTWRGIVNGILERISSEMRARQTGN